jgi:hypothetical protein
MKTTYGWTQILLHKIEQGFTLDEACVLCKVGKERVLQQETMDPDFSVQLRDLLAQNVGRRIAW